MRSTSSAARSHSRSWGPTLLAATGTSLDAVELWPIALAGFLARGGIVLFLLPIVVIPTPSGIADVIAPALISFAFGLVSPAFIAIVVTLVVSIVAAIVLGGLAGVWADVLLIRAIAGAGASGGSTAADRDVPGGVVVRAFAVRFLAHLPLWIALAWGAVRIVEATYTELVTPFEVVTPLALRVLA
ncbi:MAG TPA: hypothetical protein VGC90_07150, partial [Candidatus Limnocylindrales bacterium]